MITHYKIHSPKLCVFKPGRKRFVESSLPRLFYYHIVFVTIVTKNKIVRWIEYSHVTGRTPAEDTLEKNQNDSPENNNGKRVGEILGKQTQSTKNWRSTSKVRISHLRQEAVP